MVKAIVNGMKGTTEFTCDTNTKICTVQNGKCVATISYLSDALPVLLNFDCTAAGCQTGTYNPSDKKHEFPQSALIAIIVGCGVVIIIAATTVWIFLSRRRLRFPF